MLIYWNKRKRLHKKRLQLPQEWFGTPSWPPFHCFGTPIWPPFHCFGTPIWPPWRHVKTLYILSLLSTFVPPLHLQCWRTGFFSSLSFGTRFWVLAVSGFFRTYLTFNFLARFHFSFSYSGVWKGLSQIVCYFHMDHAPCLAPKLCRAIVFNFSLDNCNIQEKLET